jgi:hypothetical protein
MPTTVEAPPEIIHPVSPRVMQMQVDLEGRVRNLPLARTQGLRPVFEAIVNAIDAIAEKGTRGKVDIKIERDASQPALTPGDTPAQPISSFLITDTGVGFTSKNWEAFQRSDTTSKASRGGKGVGRLLYLKAFERVEIVSTFQEDGKWLTRSFVFRLPDGIVDHAEAAVPPGSAPLLQTNVRLIGFNDRYRNDTPKTTKAIATRIIEHCLERFVLGSCPDVRISDGNETLDLWQLFEEHISISGKPVTFSVKDQAFDLVHVFVSTACADRHRLHFCAQGRAVLSEALSLPDLPSFLTGPDNKTHCYYAGYVSGAFLDSTVTAERTSFLGQNEPDTLLPDEVSWSDLRKTVQDRCADFLKPQIDPITAAKIEQIRRYVETDAPQYRPLVKHKPEILQDIPPNLKKEELEVALYKYDHAYRTELKAKGEQLICAVREGQTDKEGFTQGLTTFLEDWNEAGMAELARYVAYRKAILLFLEASLCRKEDGTYRPESAIHEAVFPLKTTSDDVPPERTNLWVIDEKLIYHRFLASDLPFKKMNDVVDTASADRPDLIIFHSASALAEADAPFNAISIVEFKRPGRGEYDEKENPITQLYSYARTLRDGKAVSRMGRPINIPESTPFYGYLVCDFTPKLEAMVQAANLTRTPEGLGYFGYNTNVQMYVQVMSFEKMLQDAKKRNAILFEKLNIANS